MMKRANGSRDSYAGRLRVVSVIVALATAPIATAQGVEIRGTVVAFRTQVPMAAVEVGIPALSLATQTDSVGAFVLSGVVPGTHKLIARRLGHQGFEADVRVGATAPPPVRIVLLPLQRLDSVEVVATRIDPALLEFEEHRRMGLGSYLTRDDLVRYDSFKLSSVMPQLSGVSLVRAGQWAMLTSRRHTVRGSCGPPDDGSQTIGQPNYRPSVYEANRGLKCTCYAQVYVDGALQNPGKPADPFDVNTIPVDRIEAIEWYAGPAQTPVKYATLNSACGVLVIHTRRDIGKPPAR